MLILISPSKTMDATQLSPKVEFSIPTFQNEIFQLIHELKKKKTKDFEKMMDLSPKLASHTHHLYQNFEDSFTNENSKPAIYSFKGDVYLGMDVNSFTNKDVKEANKSIRILSGLYGLLKPLDWIQEYRLEMGRAIKIGKSNNLYQFWGSKIADEVISEPEYHKDQKIINLASDEYFKSVSKYLNESNVITINFKEWRNGKYTFLSFNAKKARGMMCHYFVKSKVKKAVDLKKFNYENYAFNETLSTENNWIFTR